MKIKELQKTVNIAWSPEKIDELYLAAGTAAQQIETLNTSATLEIYGIDLSDPSYDLTLKGSQVSQYKFQKIVWSPLGVNSDHTDGVIAAGCEGGHLQIYSASKLLAKENALIASQDKHTGAVRALDYNPFQTNLLASGACESEILIWDLNNTTTPMTPGNKTQPLEDIQSISWNRQVQHILGSVFSTRCVVWDLRKNEPIIKLSDTQSRVRFHSLQWHPTIATQLWLASEDDQAPVVQLWDLRYATAPAKTIQIHQRGILGLAWCPKDADLMVSCGKDNKILCWNPNDDQFSADSISEIASTNQWYSDVQWCPRNPALISSSNLDGCVSVYSIFGGTQTLLQTSNKIADSFPGMDTFEHAPVPQNTTHVVYHDLKRPPKWIKRPVGAKFGFGGKLISFQNDGSRRVNISQVITEPELIERSIKLEETLANGNYTDYCRQKADETENQHSRYVWYFLKANFEADPKAEMLNLLGYNQDDMDAKFNKIIDKNSEDDIDIINKKLNDIGRSDSSEVEGEYNASISTTTNESTDYSTNDNTNAFDHLHVQQKLDDDNEEIPFKIRTGEDTEGLICQALLTGNIEVAVDLCLDSNRMADAIIIASTGDSNLLARTQYRYLRKSQSYLSNIVSALVTNDWTSVISQCTTDSWKEALVATLTHGRDRAPFLCERLGERLQTESGENMTTLQSAILCYLCAGNIERLAEAWLATQTNASSNGTTTKELQDLIEVVVLFQKALELQGRSTSATGKLAELLTRYAHLLVAQGALNSALTYLGPSDVPEIVDLRERLYCSLGFKQPYAQRNASQTQNYYAKPQAAQKFSQGRVSLGNMNATLPPSNQTFNNNSVTNQPAASPQQLFNPTPISNPSTQSWNQSSYGSVAPTVTSAKPPSISDNIAHPPRPSSVSSATGAPTARSKYLLDPSVQSAPNYGQTYNPMQPVNTFNASTNNSMLSNNVPAYNQFNTTPFANATPALSATPNLQPTSAFLNPTMTQNSYGSNVGPVEVAQPALPPNVAQQTSAPGWNDPPPLKSNRPARTSVSDAQQNNIITHPLFGVDPTAAQQHQPPTVGHNPYENGGHMPSQMQPSSVPPSSGFYQPQYQNQNQPALYSQFAPVQPAQQQQQQQQQQTVEETNYVAEAPKPKPPLPEEYVYMQTVLNELRNQCVNTATNPQMKRKLDDVAKRLETLYDLLRENRLTPNTLASLNKLIQLVQNGDYANSLLLHTQMVSGTDFAQIASFMPGIKVLLQTAMQLQVYLQ